MNTTIIRQASLCASWLRGFAFANVLILVASLLPAAALADTLTLDPGSGTLPFIPAGPADLLIDTPGLPSIGIPFAAMGLVAGDVVDAISDGNDPVFAQHTDYFSVTLGSAGAPGSGVAAEFAADTAPGFSPGHASDIFVTSPAILGTNILAPAPFGWTPGTMDGDEANAGLSNMAIAPDNVNAYDLSNLTMATGVLPLVAFSLTAGSPTLAGLGATPADILVVGGPYGAVPTILFPAVGLGLPGGVALEMDALAIVLGPGGTFLGPGSVEYSLDSASAGFIGFSGADIFGLGPGPSVSLVHPHSTMGLRFADDIDALDADQYIIPEPGSVVMFVLGALALAAYRWRQDTWAGRTVATREEGSSRGRAFRWIRPLSSTIGNRLMKRCTLFTLILALVVVSERSASAGNIALTFVGSPENNNVVNYTVGWQFTVNQTIQVDGLGYFDRGANGLASAHDVAIWTSAGVGPLASATVPSGTGAALINSFRFVSISPTTLLPGSYVIGGFSASGDIVADMATAISTIPEISFVQNRATSTSSAGLVFPTTNFPSQGLGFFGPNLTVVPEPASIALAMLGMVALAAIAWRRNRRSSLVSTARLTVGSQ